MKRSIFYYRRTYRVALSFGFLEDLQDAIQSTSEDDKSTLLQIINRVIKTRYPDIKLTADEQKQLADRLESWLSGIPTDVPAETVEKPPRSLGTTLSSYLTSLSPEGVCLHLADFDIEKAATLYEQEDKDTVLAAYNAKTELEMERLTANFEAGMYGFGGGYKEDPAVKASGKGSDDDDDVVDVAGGATADSMNELLKAFGG